MKRMFSILLSVVMLISLTACGKENNNNTGRVEGENTVWYLGGSKLFSTDDEVESYFESVEDTVDPANIYASHGITEEMLDGVYTLENKEKDLDDVRKNIPFENVEFKDSSASLTILPTAVYFGVDNISSSQTRYNYSEFKNITDKAVAVIELVTVDDIGQTPCTYEIDGNTICFKQIEQTSADGEPFAYGYTGVEFKYNFELSGPYITFRKNGSSLKLKAFCLTENSKTDLMIRGYSLPNSPLVDELDYFASSNIYNYAVRRDGSYYDVAAYKISDDGRFTIYLSDGETEKTEQYAYIIQSAADGYHNSFNIVLLDMDKVYYYTDDITQREVRTLKEQGTDVNSLTEDEIEEIAEKKSDLFDDLYEEFEKQGINVTINRSSGEIAMDASVLFGGDSAVITDEGKELLNKFLVAYTTIVYNEKYDGFIEKTVVEGHTAPVSGSTYESGLPLSQERAENVKNYCLSFDTGIDISKLSTTLEAVGHSNSKPIYDSDGEIDMAACRRVSFRFVVNINF